MKKCLKGFVFTLLLIPITMFGQQLVINEFLSDPYHETIEPVESWDANNDGSRDSGDDEFIELVNNSGGTLDISGYTYTDGSHLRHTFDVNTILDDGESIVLFGAGLPSTNIPGQVAVADSGSVSLNNGGDVIVIRDAAGVLVDSVDVPADADDQAWARFPDITGDFVKHDSISAGVYYSPGRENVSGTAFPEDALTATLIINEILADPASDDAATAEIEGDANGDGVRSYWEDEFVEIVNTSGSSIDISGYTLSDLHDAGRVRHIFAANTVIEDGEMIVVFSAGTPTGIPGKVVLASEGKLDFDNSGDRLTLKNTDGNEVARYAYGADAEGSYNASSARYPDFTGDFVKHSTVSGNPVPFSPGENNNERVLVINEFLSDPYVTANGASWDANGDGSGDSVSDEFIELVNVSGETLDISGYTYTDGSHLRHTFDVNTILDADESIVLFGGGLPSTSIPGQVAVADSGSVSLNNGGDVLIIKDANGVLVDSVSYVDGEAVDQAWARFPDIVGNFVKHDSISAGVYYSPGKENVSGTAFPEDALTATLIINEILADPASDDAATTEVEGDANGDGTRSYWEDEFVEIANTSGASIDISGYTLSDLHDAGRVRHIFAANTVIDDGEMIVVFSAGTPTGIPGKVVVASEGKLDFDNSGDRLTLKDTDGNEVARYAYGADAEGSYNASSARFPDFTGDFVKHTELTSNPVAFSPGRLNAESLVVSVDDLANALPDVFALHQNYPNPFNPITTIQYDLPELSKVKIVIYNISGQKVRTLVDGTQTPGYYNITWNARNDKGVQMSSGFYFYVMDADGFHKTQKMIYLK